MMIQKVLAKIFKASQAKCLSKSGQSFVTEFLRNMDIQEIRYTHYSTTIHRLMQMGNTGHSLQTLAQTCQLVEAERELIVHLHRDEKKFCLFYSRLKLRDKNGGSCTYDQDTGLPDGNCYFYFGNSGNEHLRSSIMAVTNLRNVSKPKHLRNCQ